MFQVIYTLLKSVHIYMKVLENIVHRYIETTTDINRTH